MGILMKLFGRVFFRKVKYHRKKLKIVYVMQEVTNNGNVSVTRTLCKELNISMNKVAYIGDDINCYELLNVGIAACSINAVSQVKLIHGIIRLKKTGGNGTVRELIIE